MAPDMKSTTPTPAKVKHREKGIRIFTYPKIIFIFPTLIVALICVVGMTIIRNRTEHRNPAGMVAPSVPGEPANAPVMPPKHQRFNDPANLMGVLFLGVLAFNLLIMSVDFPRFTVVALLLLLGLVVFFLLWIGAMFDHALLGALHAVMARVYVSANSGFYLVFALILIAIFVIVYITRWLDYWVILPNEILHHHGPLSDLERYPTLNLKFDKEIPDIFEFLFLGSGKLVLHVSEERKSIVLDNVLFINSKEEALKKLMSRLEVRVTTDQEVADND